MGLSECKDTSGCEEDVLSGDSTSHQNFTLNYIIFITVCKGYVFTGVCLSTGGGGLGLCPGGGGLWISVGSLSMGVSVHGRSLSRGRRSLGGLCPWGGGISVHGVLCPGGLFNERAVRILLSALLYIIFILE